jgi:hypothetical protein
MSLYHLMASLGLILSLSTIHGAHHPSKNQSQKKNDAFKPFTGKVISNKVRLRIKPDLESHVFKQTNKDELVLIVGETQDFYAVMPPPEMKAYVFRSYVLDNIVEASKVNVRLEPNVDAPIIAQLQAGDKVQGYPCPNNHKWMEISLPSSSKLFVAKEFITPVGGPEYISQVEKKKKSATELLSKAFANAEAEVKKSYEDMAPQPVIELFQKVIDQYPEFSSLSQQAREALVHLKETYLQKKIAFLEEKAQLSPTAKEELISRHEEERDELLTQENSEEFFSLRNSKNSLCEKLDFWDSVEESLFASWNSFHSGKKKDDFYSEQKANASTVIGRVEAFDKSVKNRPGDYILKTGNSPVAYLYSNSINLDQFVGKEVTLQVSPRPNNHFAYPAYYVLGLE